jgi:hypothetical protein
LGILQKHCQLPIAGSGDGKSGGQGHDVYMNVIRLFTGASSKSQQASTATALDLAERSCITNKQLLEDSSKRLYSILGSYQPAWRVVTITITRGKIIASATYGLLLCHCDRIILFYKYKEEQEKDSELLRQ